MVCRKQGKKDGVGNYLVKEVRISSAQVLALTTPVVLIESPGPDKFLRLICGTIQLVGGTTDYGTDGDLTINYKAAGTGDAVTTSLDDIINDGTAGSISIFGTIPEIEDIALADIVNQPLSLISTANPITGDMDLRLFLMYEIIPAYYV
jgi:hypothetical protein